MSIKSLISIALLACMLLVLLDSYAADRIPLKVEKSVEGSPLTLGIPFPQGVLFSPDHVRVLDSEGNEIPSQTNLVTSWEPLDYSVKWLWVFFFSTGEEDYFLEYGKEVRKAPIIGDKIRIKNAQRKGQTSYVETGPLRFSINKKRGGFIDDVLLDLDRNGFDAADTLASGAGVRGSFLDMLDDLGIDSSSAKIHRTVREKGSGPLHAIIRLEGNYTYKRRDNRDSPFIIRIHVYAGKSYIRVFHTLTYTGIPDKHTPEKGEHELIALSGKGIIIDYSQNADPGWMLANDQIAATGLSLNYRLCGVLTYRSAYRSGSWDEMGEPRVFEAKLASSTSASLFQTGPKPNRIPPVPNSSAEKKIGGFAAHISIDSKTKKKFEKTDGWSDISDQRWGIAIGIRNFFEEYPKEISFDVKNQSAKAYLWSPKADPMSFARHSTKRDQGMIANFATGVTKTSELIFYFHPAKTSKDEIQQKMEYVLSPSVAHASPETYSNSRVYGNFSPRDTNQLEFERSLDYKFDWQLFNQAWEPWYGMFDFGDQKNTYYKNDWYRWQNNEPGIDFMYWLQFMRTGQTKYYYAAEAMSRHTMDVDNIHWPDEKPYYGDQNESLAHLKMDNQAIMPSPYLGIGRRHASQHWLALLSAHVWIEGWIASYYLAGYHRGLDIARLSANTYTRRIWGKHGLTGRRLYLSILNMVEAWDATKDPGYFHDLQERIDLILQFQNGPDQYDNLVIDRYGYSQIYASHGLYKYYQLTQDERVKNALIRHARAVRDNPPYNHEYESYLATIHSLLVGYEFTSENSFLEEALHRAELLKTDELTSSFEELGTQKRIAQALEEISQLPPSGTFSGKRRLVDNWGPTQGLRVFGWTHIYNIPWLLTSLKAKE